MNWNDLNLILTLSEAGSPARAAEMLGLSHSTVLRRLNAVEASLGTRFFERLASGYELTEAGETALKRAKNVKEEILALEGEIMGKDLKLQGEVLLTAPEGITRYLLGPILAQFGRLHPQIRINLKVTGTSLALSRREADLAIRATSTPPEHCLGRKICPFRYALFASRAYAKTVQRLPPSEYDYVMHQMALDNLPRSLWKNPADLRCVMVTDNLMALVEAVKQGRGAAILPYLAGDSEPGLTRLSEPIKELESQLWLLYHQDLRKTARVKALMNHLEAELFQHGPLIEGKKPAV